LAAVQDIFGMEDEDVFKSASRLAGGIGISVRGHVVPWPVYRLYDPVEFKELDRDGGHDKKCPEVVGKAARGVGETFRTY